MSFHAGIFFFDGRPCHSAARALAASVAPAAGDDIVWHVGDGIVIASSTDGVWMPACDRIRSAPACAIAWDGRLDNRHDLLLRLGERCAAEVDDASIALSVVERWGMDGLRFLIGEWSAVIWDGLRRTLHLARDYVGVRPLYYHADREKVCWSTDLGELARRSGRGDALSDEFAARFLAVRFRAEVTPYEGIRGVPAATCISFDGDGIETPRRFWNLNPGFVRYRDRREYEEQLRALWQDAVSSRLRTTGTVWSELSGGLDSSSVVCMADWCLANGRAGARALQPLSYVPMQSPEGDERRFIAEVEARTGVASEIVAVEPHQGLVDPDLEWVSPLAARDVGLAGARLVRDRGGRVVLSGRVGDAVMGCSPDNSIAVLDDLSSGHLFSALSKMRRWSIATKKPFVEIAWRLARARVSAPIGSSTTSGIGRRRDSLLSERLSDLVADEDDQIRDLLSNVRPANRGVAALVLEYAFRSALNTPQPPYGLFYSYPFTHRPLVEFLSSIPAEELSAPGEMRSLMRRAFAGLVPSRVLSRTSKGYYSPALARAVRPVAQSMQAIAQLEVVRRGWIDPSRLHDAIRVLIDGGGGTRPEVQRALRLEQWLASRDRRGPAAIPQRKEVANHEVLNA